LDINKKFFALLEKIDLEFYKGRIEDDTNHEKSWREGGLVGIKVGRQEERERIMAIFADLNSQPLSKKEFTDKFTEAVGE
jgi:hypothetical protein